MIQVQNLATNLNKNISTDNTSSSTKIQPKKNCCQLHLGKKITLNCKFNMLDIIHPPDKPKIKKFRGQYL